MNYLNIGIIETHLSTFEPSWLIDDLFVKPIVYNYMRPVFKFILFSLRYSSVIYIRNKMKTKKYNTVGTIQQSNNKFIETEANSIFLSYVYITT